MFVDVLKGQLNLLTMIVVIYQKVMKLKIY